MPPACPAFGFSACATRSAPICSRPVNPSTLSSGDRQLSKKMLEHYSHQRLKAKGQMLTRMEERRKKKESA